MATDIHTQGTSRRSARFDSASSSRVLGYLHLQDISNRLSREIGRVLTALAMEESAFMVLSLLKINCGGTSTPAVLAAMYRRSRSHLTRTCDLLVEQGLITRRRAETDRRTVDVQITEKGKRRVEQVTKVFEATLTQFLGTLGVEDAIRIHLILSRDGALVGKAEKQVQAQAF
ncbi:MarR family winged helix-turn-helix transcriptional regulator [Pseudomonas aeruginosa]|uniref:MarR family winged helix-turn-helix transcriptional regulator n=1 Tax=Pseudomonas aeruginosa TaxID=287 RepID=UPI0006770378|nr:MarR family transcriptional regulator [Pseudomonas aeruginosa]